MRSTVCKVHNGPESTVASRMYGRDRLTQTYRKGRDSGQVRMMVRCASAWKWKAVKVVKRGWLRRAVDPRQRCRGRRECIQPCTRMTGKGACMCGTLVADCTLRGNRFRVAVVGDAIMKRHLCGGAASSTGGDTWSSPRIYESLVAPQQG